MPRLPNEGVYSDDARPAASDAAECARTTMTAGLLWRHLGASRARRLPPSRFHGSSVLLARRTGGAGGGRCGGQRRAGDTGASSRPQPRARGGPLPGRSARANGRRRPGSVRPPMCSPWDGQRARALVLVAAGDDSRRIRDDGAVVEKHVDVVLRRQQRADVALQYGRLVRLIVSATSWSAAWTRSRTSRQMACCQSGRASM